MQNDMRDRLIDLLYEAEGQVNNDYPTVEQIANHLIENGVVLPPCKVGDKVWLLTSLNWKRTEWGIKEGKVSMVQQKADKSWKFRVTENHSVQDYTVDSIGKTVFLTKEQAEQKLKEMRVENG